MVKADLTKDYYADLELQPGADINDIKKQFKKLALRYHPDRNPGREAEVNSKFQTIQAAHEILGDPEQRAKYDSGRLGRRSVPTYGGYKPAPRGNPYANAGSQWAPPPKPHGTPRAQPTASAGSSRYNNWKAPPPSSTTRKPAPGSTEARNASTAWEQMKHSTSKARSGDIPKSGRAESNAFKHTPPPKSDRPGRDEFRSGETPGTRPVPKPPVPKRPNGWHPGQAGDEPSAANTSSYNTTQFKDRAPPVYPPKTAPHWSQTYPSQTDPQQFKESRASAPYSGSGGEKTNPFEGVNTSQEGSSGSNRPSSSSPTQGSRTQAQPNDDFVGSPPKRTHSHADFSPSSGKGPFGSSRSSRHSSVPHTRNTRKTTHAQADTSSEDESETDDPNQPWQPKPRKFATPRARSFKSASMSAGAGRSENPGLETRTKETRKPSLVEFRQWFRQHNAAKEKSNIMQSDGSADGTEKAQQEDKPMYAKPYTQFSNTSRPLSNISRHMLDDPVKPSEVQSSASYAVHKESSSEAHQHPFPHIKIQSIPIKETPTSPDCLNVFEMQQLNIVESLLSHSGGTPGKASGTFKCQNTENIATIDLDKEMRSQSDMRKCEKTIPDRQDVSKRHIHRYQSPLEAGSPTKRKPAQHRSDPAKLSLGRLKSFSEFNQQHANTFGKPSFSPFSTKPPTENDHTYFSNISTENINTKFSTADWQGKFEAGDYFRADEQGRNSKTPSRAQSTSSKTRGRSPTKSQSPSRPQTGSSSHAPDINANFSTKFASTSNETPVESPGGTKFSAAEWERTFKAQTFAPPPPSPAPFGLRPSLKKTRTGTFGRPPIVTKTAGQKAAMVESPESSEGENIYKGRSSRSSSQKSGNSAPVPAPAEPMDIDSPAEKPDPLATHREAGSTTFDKATGEPRNVHVEPSRAEWRTDDTNATNTANASKVTSVANNLPAQTEIPRKPSPALPPRPAPETRTAPQAEATRDDLDFADLKDLENIEPIQNPAKGLDSFGDISSTLPFPSQASNRTIFRTNITTEELELPNPPKAPQVPTATGTATRPNVSSWHSYLASFKAYMAEWDIFNTAMLSHFVARKQQADSMPANWLESRDDQWIELYRKGCKEDMRVREWYNVACERHADAMQKFASFRLRMKDMEEKEAAWGDGMKKSTV